MTRSSSRRANTINAPLIGAEAYILESSRVSVSLLPSEPSMLPVEKPGTRDCCRCVLGMEAEPSKKGMMQFAQPTRAAKTTVPVTMRRGSSSSATPSRETSHIARYTFVLACHSTRG